MPEIHPTALVDPSAELGCDVTVGPYAIIEAGVRIGDGCKLGPRVVIHAHTTLGARNIVDIGAVLGGDAQDVKCTSPDTYLEIGDDNTIREYVTIHRSNHEGGFTRIGNHNFLMSYVHVGHDCTVGNYIMMANLVQLGGHCVIDDRAVLGGMSSFHQKVRIGRMVMVGGLSGCSIDAPPFCMVEGRPGEVKGLNLVGLRRNDIPEATRTRLRRAVRMLFTSRRNRGDALDELTAEADPTPEVQELLAFVRAMREGHNSRQLER